MRTYTLIYSGATDQNKGLLIPEFFNSGSILVKVESAVANSYGWSRAGNLFESYQVAGIGTVRTFRSRLYFGQEIIEFIPHTLPYQLTYFPREWVKDSIISIWECPVSPNPVTRSISQTTAITQLVNPNDTRKGVTLTNFGESPLILGNLAVVIQPEGYYETPYNYRGEIRGVWQLPGNGFVQIKEYF